MINKPLKSVIMKRILLLAFCLLALTSCSTKIAYNFLGYVLNWYVDDYVSLNRQQQKQVDSAIKEFHDWHRATQLTIYANYIEELVKTLESTPATQQYLHDESDKVQEFLDTSTNYLIPTVVDVLSTLNDKQVAELLKNLSEEQKKYEKEFIKPSRDKVVKTHVKDIKDYVKPFFGSLNKEQKQLIAQWGEQLVEYEHFSLKQQKASAELLSEALNKRTDKKNLDTVVRQLMFYKSDDWMIEYQDAVDINQKLTFNMLANLYNSQTEKQRKKTLKKLNNYRKDFLDLASSKDKKTLKPEIVSLP